jgi:SAM-dependent methyltransferase
MSFPWDDRAWCEVGDLLDAEAAARPGLRILAPDLFWWRVPALSRYVPGNLEPGQTYDCVVVHKGEMAFLPRPFVEIVVATMRPVLANEVFVVFDAHDRLPVVDRSSPHLLAFVRQLAQLPEHPREHHPALDDRILGSTPTLRQFASMTPAEARHAQDEFFAGGGYRYPTRRDQAYYRELLAHRDLVLEQAVGRRVVELCAGAFPSGAVPAGATLVRSDFSLVGVADARARDRGDAGIVHLVCDAAAVAVADASCDVVLFVDSIEHVFEPATVVREAGRILRPGGAFLVTFSNRNSLNQMLTRALGHPQFVTNHQHIREFTLAEIEGMLADAGLVVESTAGIELRPYWGVPSVDALVRDVVDDDEEFVEAMRVLGMRAGAEYAYVGVVRASKLA